MTMRTVFGLLAGVLLAVATPAFAGSPDARIEKQLKALDYQYKIDEDGDYSVVFDTDEDGKRTQLAYVRSAVESYGSLRIREIWSPGYKVPAGGMPASVATRLLKASHEGKFGAWTLQGDYAVYVVQIPADADDETLRDALAIALQTADEMEAQLTPGKDDL